MSKKRAQPKQKNKTPKKHKESEEESQKLKNQEQHNKQQKFSLYSLLQLQQGPKSTIDQIKKQYRKLVMLYHPDKNLGDQTAKQKFHKLKQAYDILSDPEKKKIYDETGTLGENFDQNSFQTAYHYFRNLYKKIEKEDIIEFQKKYRNGQMEREDLNQFYESHGGDMTLLLQSIPLSRNEDIPRFIKYFEQRIGDKTLKKYKIFDKTKDKIRQLKDETQQFQKQQKQRQQKMKQLTLAIRNKSNKSFLDSLQAKYGAKKQKAEQKTVEKSQKRQKRKKKE